MTQNVDPAIPEEGLDLRAAWRVLLHGWWIFAICFVLFSGAAYAYTLSKTPIYEATAKVRVQGAQNPGLQTTSDLEASNRLARDFGELITTRPVLELILMDLDLPYGTELLKAKIRTISPRSIIQIRVLDPDPSTAALIANSTAEIFIEEFERRELERIARFQASLSAYGIEADSSLIAAQAGTLGALSLIEEAVPAESPSSPNKPFTIALAILIAAFFATAVVVLREFLDDSVDDPDELQALTGLINLGSVPRFRSSGPNRTPMLYRTGDEGDRSHLAEAYQFIEMNLEFAKVNLDDAKSILITSTTAAEGKTTTIGNLASSLARQGRSVIVVDTDLRRAGLSHAFDLGGRPGVSETLIKARTLEQCLWQTEMDNLRVLPAGTRPPDPGALLRSPNMAAAVQEIERMADIVLFDSPPLNAVVDSLLLAPLMDGVVMVVAAGNAHRREIGTAIETLTRTNTPILGTLLNQVSPSMGRRYGYYGYYGYGDTRESRWQKVLRVTQVQRIRRLF